MVKNNSQRTKDRVKPSNSSRSANVLLSKTTSSFAGFSAVKDRENTLVLSNLSTTSLNKTEPNFIDSDFQLVLKKISKKDPTSKFKALQEFISLCNDSPLPAVEAVVPFWPKTYCILAVDLEHNVREAVQLAHRALIKRVGKKIAPYLKQLASHWFTSQFDTHPLVASTAQASFRETFPENKYVNAIIHCQKEILSYIYNVIKLHVSSSGEVDKSKYNNSKLHEMKHQGILISCLQSYCFYLKNVPREQMNETIEIQKHILDSKNYWELVRNEIPQVKISFFNILTLIIENATDLLNDEKKKTIITVMNSIDETDPGVAAAAWESMLTIMNNYDDWYTVINVEKLILPKLWHILKNGGQGCANTIYPALLPLSNQLLKLNFDCKIFFINLFDNIRQGLGLQTVKFNSSAITITKSFIECLRYAIVYFHNNDLDFCRKLIKEQLMPIVKLFITEYPMKKAVVFNEVSDLIRHWSKNQETTEMKYYDKLLSTFWTELYVIFEFSIANTNNNVYKSPLSVHEMGIKLLISLQNPDYLLQTNNYVKFEDTCNLLGKPDRIETSDHLKDDLFHCEFRSFINKLCIKYFDEMIKTTSTVYTSVFTDMISHFHSESFFVTISERYDCKNLIEFYNIILKPALAKNNKENVSLIHFIFILIEYINDEEKNIVLNSLLEVSDDKILHSVIHCGLIERNLCHKSVKEWLKTPKVTEYFHEIIKKLSDDSFEKSHKELILRAFQTIDDDFCVDEVIIINTIDIICNILTKCDNPSQDIIELLCHLLKITWCHDRLINTSLKMLNILIQLNITFDSFINNSQDYLRKSLINELKYIHEKFSKDKIINILESCMQNICDIIFSSDTWNENATAVAQILIECFSGYDYYKAISMLIKISHVENSFIKSWILEIKNIIDYAEIVSGSFFTVNPIRNLSYELSSTFDTTMETAELPEKMVKCLQWSLLYTTLLNNFLQKVNIDDSKNKLEIFLNDNLSDLFILLNDILIITSFGKLYCYHYKFAYNYDSVNKIHNQLQEQCNELQKLIPINIWNRIHIEFLNFNKYWTEFGSIFSQYLQYCNYDNSYKLERNLKEKEMLEIYLNCEETLDFIDHVNAIVSARNLLSNNNNDNEENSLSIEILNRFLKEYDNNEEFFLLNRDISSMSWIQFYLPLEIIRLLTKLITTIPTELDSTIWNSVIMLLTSWQTSLNGYKYLHEDFKLQCLTVALSQLFCAFQNVMKEQNSIIMKNLPSELINKWKKGFIHHIEQGMINIWKYNGNSFNKIEKLTSIFMFNYLGDAIKSMNKKILIRNCNNTKISSEMKPLIDRSLELLLSPLACFQLSAHYILNFLIPTLSKQDQILINRKKFDLKKMNIYLLLDPLSNIQDIINIMLKDFKLCDMIRYTVQPHTDSYVYVLKYFLMWINVFKMCENANTDLRCQYIEALKNEHFPFLMNNIFKLMPIKIYEDSNNGVSTARFIEFFEVPPSLNFNENLSTWKLDHIVCWLYISCLRHLPVLTRQWWSTVDSRVANIIEKLTILYVSPILCRKELLNGKLSDFPNMQIRIHQMSREVTAFYQMDDKQLELKIVIPTNYPLQSVTLEPTKNLNNTTNWKSYHLQLLMFLTHQNGSIRESLLMWKRNLDKKFSGVEECYICFCIFHINTHQIPKLSCNTCRKKFHALCLYQWFSTSQKSTCPICRNVF